LTQVKRPGAARLTVPAPTGEEDRPGVEGPVLDRLWTDELAVIIIVIGIAVFLYRKLTKLIAEEPDQKG
jgi:hypothetical protein